jgi:hypothetical protein
MLDPGTAEALEIPCNLRSFHEHELIAYEDAALASQLYSRWRQAGGAAPGYGTCVGYKVPLFLGGDDEVGNLETSDIDVYWHVTGQLISTLCSPA